MPRAVTKSAANEMLGAVWIACASGYHIHRDSLDTWPEPEIRPAMQISELNSVHWYASPAQVRIVRTGR